MKPSAIIACFASIALCACALENTPSSSLMEEAETSIDAIKETPVSSSIVAKETYAATQDDESALDVGENENIELSNAVIVKSSGNASSADAAAFTGINAAVRVYDQATLTLSDCEILSDASNATGVFAYGNGTVYLSDSTVTVTGSGSGGIQVAGGGTLYANNLHVSTTSKAAIRSDRGGGTMVIDGGEYVATGTDGCPSIYSTADIKVSNATCTSTQSRAVIIEGKNTVTLDNCILSGNGMSRKSIPANILLYQSASGDAKDGTSVFNATDSAITAECGAMFYCTNTQSVINLENVDLVLSPDHTLLVVSAGRWGKEGKNGGDCTLNATSQALAGEINVDEISQLSLNLTDSSFAGSIASQGLVSVSLDDSSKWTLTGDSSISRLQANPECIDLNGYTLYVDGIPYDPSLA